MLKKKLINEQGQNIVLRIIDEGFDEEERSFIRLKVLEHRNLPHFNHH